MSVVEKPACFKSSDGKEFDDKKEAESYEFLIKSMEQYDTACRSLKHALSINQKTADGHPFEIGKFREYFWLNDYRGWPELERIESTYRFELSDFDEGKILVLDLKGNNWTRYKISSLYAEEFNAKKALLLSQEKRLKEFQTGITILKTELE